MERANTNLILNTDLQKDTAHRASAKEDQYESTIEGLRKEIDLLNQDKTFMTRENATLHDRIGRLEQ